MHAEDARPCQKMRAPAALCVTAPAPLCVPVCGRGTACCCAAAATTSCAPRRARASASPPG
eukprot:6073048-Prymnesium_polylepis.1